MKTCVLLLATMAVMCMAPTVHDLIRREVHSLLNADPDLTADHCITKCDALFDLANAIDETGTDFWCKVECECQIAHNCNQHTHPTHRPHTAAP